MPLPGSGFGAWPPQRIGHLYDRFEEHSAWYSGDTNMLSDYYTQGTRRRGRRGDPPGAGRGSPGLYPSSGSLWRLDFDRFWARAVSTPWRRQMLHLPLAADISTTSADLVFADPVKILVEGAHTPERDPGANAIQERIDYLSERLGLQAVLTEAAETGSALGGVYLRVTWDEETDPECPMLTSVDADQAVPIFRWGRLVAVTFWKVVEPLDQDEKYIWRHLEMHEKGYIHHGLYRGTDEDLGEPQPLSEMFSDWGSEEDDLGRVTVETGIDDLTAVYIPNMRPNRVWRGSEHGRSDYDGVESLMDALDETWTSWMRDLRMARSRIMVPEEYLEQQGKGKGSLFDLDQDVFVTLPMAVSRDEGAITMNQFQIRAADHQQTSIALLERIVAAAGYSESTFGLNEIQRGVTATEIVSRERRSYVTRAKKIAYWRLPLRKILSVLLQVDAMHFNGPGAAVPRVDFSDAVQEDPGKLASTVVTLRQALAASTDTLVRMVHPEWSDEEIAREVKLIDEERLMTNAKTAVVASTSVNPRNPAGIEGGHQGDPTVQGPGSIRQDKLPPGSTGGSDNGT